MKETADTNPGGGHSPEYSPEEHDGLFYFHGRHVIVADAKQANLMSLPEDVREAVAKETATQLALMDFSRGPGGVIIEIADEAIASILEDGYKKGLRLLGFGGE